MPIFQMWLVTTLRGIKLVAPFMESKWGWAICESVHFIGLSLLIGTIGVFDLRLLGFGRRVPILALHRLIPWGVAGFVINIVTGLMFLVTEPDQYIFNPSFHLKLLCIAIAGLNVALFYLIPFRKLGSLAPGAPPPALARAAGAASLCCWITVIACGRFLTFYRPVPCDKSGPGLIATCIPQRHAGQL